MHVHRHHGQLHGQHRQQRQDIGSRQVVRLRKATRSERDAQKEKKILVPILFSISIYVSSFTSLKNMLQNDDYIVTRTQQNCSLRHKSSHFILFKCILGVTLGGV